MLFSIVLIVLAITCAVGLASLLFAWINWHDSLRQDAARIDFSSFVKFYELNPNRWFIRHSSVECRTSKNIFDANDVFCFGFFDYYKYRKWLKCNEKRKEQSRHAEAIKRMMDVVREDIAKAEAEAGKLSSKSIDELIDILRASTYENKEQFILLLKEIKLLNKRCG